MPRGPIPTGDARRRNQPTIGVTVLPSEGRKGRVPDPPSWITLGTHGMAWWTWAWRTPQATQWSMASIGDVVARRAALVDDLAALEHGHSLNLGTVLGLEPSEQLAMVDAVFRRLARLAGEKLSIERAMLAIDTQLGLTTKAMLQMRLAIAVDEVAEQRNGRAKLAAVPGPTRTRPKAVDRAVAGS